MATTHRCAPFFGGTLASAHVHPRPTTWRASSPLGGEANAARVRRPRQAARAPRVDVLRGLRPEEIHHRLARVRHARLEQSARGAGDGHDPAEALRGAARDVHHRAHGRGVHRLQRHPQRGLHRDAPKWHEREEVERSEEVDERNGASTGDDGFL